MRLFVTVIVLACASWVAAQAQAVDTPAGRPIAPQAPAAKQGFRPIASSGAAPVGAKPAADVPPTAAVVTLKGVCKDKQAKGACEAVITREDLDKYSSVFAPDAAPSARGRLAVQYAGTMAYSALAEQQGLDKNPAVAKEIETEMKLVRQRILSSAYLQKLQIQTPPVAEADIQNYYETHRDQYEQIQVRRLAVPLAVPNESGRPLDRAAVKAEMEEVRQRAAAGEDLGELQLDAYKHLHILAPPPPTNVMPLRRNVIQGDEAKAFDLKAGEMTDVLDLPAAFAIVKVESKEPVPLQSAHQEIEAVLRQERMKDQISKLSGKISAQFNLEYLGLPSQPDLFAPTPITAAASRSRVARRMPTAPSVTRP
jgi:hypothetical protein